MCDYLQIVKGKLDKIINHKRMVCLHSTPITKPYYRIDAITYMKEVGSFEYAFDITGN